jgi:hypothetical protein
MPSATTGSPEMCSSASMRAASFSDASGSIVITLSVMMSRTRIVVSFLFVVVSGR